MSTSAIDSQGILFQVGDGASPEVFTTVPEISSLEFGGGARTEIDVTDINSTVKAYKTGLRDANTVTFDINYRPGQTQHDAIRSNYNAATPQGTLNYKCTFTDDSPATVWTFAARCTEFPVTIAVDEVVKSSVTLRIDDSGITET